MLVKLTDTKGGACLVGVAKISSVMASTDGSTIKVEGVNSFVTVKESPDEIYEACRKASAEFATVATKVALDLSAEMIERFKAAIAGGG